MTNVERHSGATRLIIDPRGHAKGAILRIPIVNDHPMVAEGIQSILESHDDVEVIATLSDGQQIINQVAGLDPDVVLLDLNMPGIGELIRYALDHGVLQGTGVQL